MCQNCGKHEANVRYTQIINGVKKEMALCEECSNKLGIETDMHFDFNMPIDIPSFLGPILGDYEHTEFMPSFIPTKQLQCDHCHMTYDELIESGTFGCSNCYETFSDRIDSILKNLQGSNRHVGRKASGWETKEEKVVKKEPTNKKKQVKTENQTRGKVKVEELKEKLEQAVKEERYEDAAKLRDEIKKQEENKDK